MHLKQIALRSARAEGSNAPGIPANGDQDDHPGTDPFDDASPHAQRDFQSASLLTADTSLYDDHHAYPALTALRGLEGDVAVQRNAGSSRQADGASLAAPAGSAQASYGDRHESSGESSASTDIETDRRRVHAC
ncbi:hypothetical protein HK405_000927, partial [Cladochytrium tenue]